MARVGVCQTAKNLRDDGVECMTITARLIVMLMQPDIRAKAIRQLNNNHQRGGISKNHEKKRFYQ